MWNNLNIKWKCCSVILWILLVIYDNTFNISMFAVKFVCIFMHSASQYFVFICARVILCSCYFVCMCKTASWNVLLICMLLIYIVNIYDRYSSVFCLMLIRGLIKNELQIQAYESIGGSIGPDTSTWRYR